MRTTVQVGLGPAAGLFDVDVDQFAGAGAFVAADDLPGGPVQEREPVQFVPGEDAVHGRSGHCEDRADAGRAPVPAGALG